MEAQDNGENMYPTRDVGAPDRLERDAKYRQRSESNAEEEKNQSRSLLNVEFRRRLVLRSAEVELLGEDTEVRTSLIDSTTDGAHL